MIPRAGPRPLKPIAMIAVRVRLGSPSGFRPAPRMIGVACVPNPSESLVGGTGELCVPGYAVAEQYAVYLTESATGDWEFWGVLRQPAAR